MLTVWIVPDHKATSNITIFWGTDLFGLIVSVFFKTIHTSVRVVFLSEKVRSSLNEVSEVMNGSNTSGYIKTIFKKILQHQNKSQNNSPIQKNKANTG